MFVSTAGHQAVTRGRISEERGDDGTERGENGERGGEGRRVKRSKKKGREGQSGQEGAGGTWRVSRWGAAKEGKHLSGEVFSESV